MSTLGDWCSWAKTRLVSQVPGLVPWLGDAGLADADACAQHRSFDLRISSLGVDDGLAAPTAPRFAATVQIRIIYELRLDKLDVELEAESDVDLVVTALLMQSTVTKVDGHDIPSQPSVEILHDGAAILVSYPVVVHYRR